ncbi:MAG: metallophosphoesterase [Solirubrobacteraceae bacterium]
MSIRHRTALGAVAAVAAAGLAAAPGAQANPAGKTTLQETITSRAGAFRPLVAGPGESYVLRTNGFASARRSRTRTRRSLAFFGQLTDPQIADEMSPARVEFVDPAGGSVSASWRPQEAFGAQTFDATIRNLNANPRSPVRQASGARRRMGFIITTGDLADNQQLNETRWFMDVLNGRRVDPFSGTTVAAGQSCGIVKPPLTAAEAATLNADVAARTYTGVQDYRDYDVPQRWGGYWDPNQAPPAAPKSLYAAFPRYPGILDAAQRPFTPQGASVPWYISRGNHDGLIQGNAPASNALFKAIATSCLKVFPSQAVNPADFRGLSPTALFKKLGNPTFIASLLSGAGLTPPDPSRRFVSKQEYKKLATGADRSHGFGYVDPAQNRASNGTASYYAFSPAKGILFISLDTVAEGGGANGNLDNPQYQWLKRVLDANSSLEYRNGRLVRDGDPDKLIVVYHHHTLETMDNPTPDEAAGKCTQPNEAGCDADPRNSRPIHLGLTGKDSYRDLLLTYPNVVLAVVGHTHHNAVNAYRRGRTGLWQINTASHVDYPQQSRQIEIMDNRDGTLSFFGTILNTAAPVNVPKAGTTAFTTAQLPSISRLLAANDPQSKDDTSGGGTGSRRDRNVELVIRNPLTLSTGSRPTPAFTGAAR